jgi:dTDP-4-amino-4,6-dideoxygalactose transaminase
MATSNAMIHNGIKPVFADIDTTEYCISRETIEPRVTAQTRLLIPVHFAGQTCRMDGIHRLAKEKGLFVIEDAAHAIGSQYDDGSPVGNCEYSDLTIFSFHPVKTITTGEGGAVTTNNQALYEKLIDLRSHGITKSAEKLTDNPGPWYHEMHALSHNFRLTDLQAALGISQLKKLEAFINRRREIVERYNAAFKSLNNLKIPCERSPGRSAFHLYVLKVDFEQIGMSRAALMDALKQRSIGTQVHYIPVYRQPYYQEFQDYHKTPFDAFPHMEAYYAHALSIPLYPKMTDADVDYVIETVADLVQ